MKIRAAFPFFLILLAGCSPLKNSPKEEKYQMELTLQEVQTNVDDLRHDMQTFKSEWDLMEGKVNQQDTLSKEMKEHHMESLKSKVDYLEKQLSLLKKSLALQESKQADLSKDMEQLTSHANETTAALVQHKERLHEIEKGVVAQNRKLDDVAKLKTTLEAVAQSVGASSFDGIAYKVKSGDSLEKIAKQNGVTIEDLKKANDLSNHLIVVGQKLKIPKAR
jgi:LysM repeat protein